MGGVLPPLDLRLHARLLGLVAGLVADRLVDGVHDVSDGGLGVALAEMMVKSGTGCRVAGISGHTELFGEGPSRVLVSVPPARWATVRGRCSEAGVPVTELGLGGGDALVIDGLLELGLSQRSRPGEALFPPCSRSARRAGLWPAPRTGAPLGEQGPPIEGTGRRDVGVPPQLPADALSIKGDGRRDGRRLCLHLAGPGGQEGAVIKLGRAIPIASAGALSTGALSTRALSTGALRTGRLPLGTGRAPGPVRVARSVQASTSRATPTSSRRRGSARLGGGRQPSGASASARAMPRAGRSTRFRALAAASNFSISGRSRRPAGRQRRAVAARFTAWSAAAPSALNWRAGPDGQKVAPRCPEVTCHPA